MKAQTRDNLIYVMVGLGVGAIVVADFVYAEIHGTQMWIPSKFSFRIVTSTGLLTYFVIREAVSVRATLSKTVAAVFLAAMAHVAVMCVFRSFVERLGGISYSAAVLLELFFIFHLATWYACHSDS